MCAKGHPISREINGKRIGPSANMTSKSMTLSREAVLGKPLAPIHDNSDVHLLKIKGIQPCSRLGGFQEKGDSNTW